jgi:hypothetical protein
LPVRFPRKEPPVAQRSDRAEAAHALQTGPLAWPGSHDSGAELAPRFARGAELDGVLRNEAELVGVRAEMAELWGTIRVFQEALDVVARRCRALGVAGRLGRALERDLGEAAAVRAFVCEFYELQVQLDGAKAKMARDKRAVRGASGDTRGFRAKFHRLGVYLHQLTGIRAVTEALEEFGVPTAVNRFLART